MSLIQKNRTVVYDTPATYDQFDGGINTNLSNEALELNELRDGLNCHYINKSLVNRRGEKVLKTLNLPITSRPQGDFMFSAENRDYIISVRNGHIFYGMYTGSGDSIDMSLLMVEINHTQARDDCENYIIDLEIRTEVDLESDTEGYIYRFYPEGEDDPNSEEELSEEEPDYQETLIIQNTKRVQGVPIKINMNPHGSTAEPDSRGYYNKEIVCFLLATGLRLLRIEEKFDEDSNDYYLYGYILEAYKPNSWEIQNIGVNNLSPFPNHYADEVDKVPKTMIGQIATNPKELAVTNLSGGITCTALVNCLQGFEAEDFYYKWEARIGKGSEWQVLWFWDKELNPGSGSAKNSKGKKQITITGEQLNTLKSRASSSQQIIAGDELFIRCTLTSDFQRRLIDLNNNTYSFDRGEYENDINHVPLQKDYVADEAIAQYSKTHISRKVRAKYLPELTLQQCIAAGYTTPKRRKDEGYAAPDDQFLRMHSCTKVVADGSKLLIYDDAYNSCEWYKTVIGMSSYLSYGGNLNFRTEKNEKLIGVVVFDSHIVAFSDNETLGGNIAVVTGNGDDYNDGNYYSPYKRIVVNTAVSCDSYNTIQIAENYIIFKYRKDIYLLDTKELDSERVQVVTINDKVKQKLNNVEFPLDRIRDPKVGEHYDYDFHEYCKCLKPDEIFSEVCDGYYGIIFPHQGFHLDTYEYPDNALKQYEGSNQEYIDKLRGRRIENMSVKPGLRWKCYFRNGHMYQDSSKVFYPWLRDTSKYLNIVGVIDINGETTMVTEASQLVQFNNEDYDGLDEYNYKVRMTTRCYDMELPTLCKFMDNLNVYYNRDFTDIIHCNMYVKNESGYYIYTPNEEAYVNLEDQPIGEVKFDERYMIDDALNLLPGYEPLSQYDQHPYVDPMDKPVQVLNEVALDTATLDRPSFTSKTLTPKYRFPFLSAQFILEMKSNQAFSLSALTFSFTSHDMPDFTREKLYRDILKGNILK